MTSAALTTAASALTATERYVRPGLLHTPYTPGQMTYDLRRLRLTGLIHRVEHTNRYTLTPDGIKVAIFCTKLHNRLLRPLLAASQPQAPPELRDAFGPSTSTSTATSTEPDSPQLREDLTQTSRS